jgi:hypothetical protein
VEKIAASLWFPKFSISWRAEVQDQKLQIIAWLYVLVWFYAFLAPPLVGSGILVHRREGTRAYFKAETWSSERK